MNEFVVIIPARYASTRLPGKPLLDLGGKPLIYWAWKQAKASAASRVVVATDDERIMKACEAFGAEAVMTRDDHVSGTDRLAEVVDVLKIAPETLVVNLQGDEPEVAPEVINQVAGLLAASPDASMATLCEPLNSMDEYENPNVVKVVKASTGRALYFSRASIPFSRDSQPNVSRVFRHIGLYAYRPELLAKFVEWPESPLESTEKLEQLRVLEAGLGIWIDEACSKASPGVDTPEQLAELNLRWSQRA